MGKKKKEEVNKPLIAFTTTEAGASAGYTAETGKKASDAFNKVLYEEEGLKAAFNFSTQYTTSFPDALFQEMKDGKRPFNIDELTNISLTVKKILSSYRGLKKTLDDMEREKEEDLANIKSSWPDGMPPNKNINDPTWNIYIKIENFWDNDIIPIKRELNRIEKAVNLLNWAERRVIKLYYLEEQELTEEIIAERLNYSEGSSIRRIKREAYPKLYKTFFQS